MRVNGTIIPHLKVRATLGKVISGFEYTMDQKSGGGGRLSHVRLRPLDFSVPVIIRRPAGKSWEEVMEEVSDVIYTREEASIFLIDSSPRYVFGRIVDLSIGEEKDTVLEADMQVISEYGHFFGLPRTAKVDTTASTHTVAGQLDALWELEVKFTASATRFEFWAGNDIYLQVNQSFIAGDTLLIKYVGREVTLNGRDIRNAVSISSNYSKLPTGANQLRASTACTLKYNELYY